MQLPFRLQKSPIIESILEIRFTPKVPAEAVLGLVFASLSAEDIDTSESLDVANIPYEIRQQDENLKFAATHRIVLKKKGLNLLVGPNTIAFSNIEEYIGWSEFKKFSLETIDALKPEKFALEFVGCSLRYINFFKSDIFEKSSLNIEVSNEPVRGKKMFTCEHAEGDFLLTFTVSNNAVVGKQFGSIIDVATRLNTGTGKLDVAGVKEIFDDSHDIVKYAFFKLVGTELVEEFQPEYSS